jgi:hypothetical protein
MQSALSVCPYTDRVDNAALATKPARRNHRQLQEISMVITGLSLAIGACCRNRVSGTLVFFDPYILSVARVPLV